jgi:hypothetical protein
MLAEWGQTQPVLGRAAASGRVRFFPQERYNEPSFWFLSRRPIMKTTTTAWRLGTATLIPLVGALGLVQCKQQDEQRAVPTSTSSRAPQAWDALDIAAFAAAEVKIEHLRKQSSVDWAAIRAAVDETMAVVKATDQRHGLRYAAEIPAALARCEKGEQPKVHQQVIAKGLQHVAVLGIAHELSLLAGGKAADKAKLVDRIASFAKGIRPTFVRRDKDYFEGQPTLVTELDQAVSGLRAAVKADQPVKAASQQLLDAITRTYALSVRYEIEQVEKLRLKDLPACEVKRAEAVIFYRIIRDRVTKQAPQAHGTIEKMLEAAPDQMSAAILTEQLAAGLPAIQFPE